MYKGFRLIVVSYFLFLWIYPGNAQELGVNLISETTTSKSIQIDITVYEIARDIENVTTPIHSDDTYQQLRKSMVGLFPYGDIDFGYFILHANRDGWTWDGDEQVLTHVKTIARPKLLLEEGIEGAILIGDQSPIQYFEKRSDGLFELKTADEMPRIKVSVLVNPSKTLFKEDIHFVYDIHFEYSYIKERKSIPGVEFDVGIPVMNTENIQSSLRMKPGEMFGLIGKTTNQSLLLIQIKGDYAKEQSS